MIFYPEKFAQNETALRETAVAEGYLYIQIISKSTRQMSPQYVWNVNKQSKHYAVEIRILIHNQFVGKSNLLVISLQPEGFTITVKSFRKFVYSRFLSQFTSIENAFSEGYLT